MAIDIKAIQAKAVADKQAQEDQSARNAAPSAVQDNSNAPATPYPVQEPSQLKAALERAAQQKAAEEQQAEQPRERVFYGEFQTHQNYLTPKGVTVSFYRGYFATLKEELIDFCLGLDGVQEVTGKIKAADIPVAPKRDRNRNWASAGPSDPTMISPAELLQRVVQNSSNMTTSARSDSSN